jgi:hypothetical protein
VRLLFLDFDLRYVNPTRTLVPPMLRECAETICYGPGYQPAAVLEAGLEAFHDAHGPFDYVVGNEFSLLVYDDIAADPGRLRHHGFHFGRRALATVGEMGGWFSRYRGPKLVLLLESDVFNLTPSRMAALSDVRGLIGVLWDRGFMESIRDSRDLGHESYAAQANDNFFEFVTAQARRVIALPFFLSEAEFGWGCLEDRPPVWSVPGAAYYYRRQAREALARKGVLRTQLPWMKVYGGLARLGVRPYANRLLASMYGAQFVETLERSRYCYTCGSAQHMHIRKHLEIPARGAVLVTAPVRGLEAMGFRDGVNCFVRMPGELAALHDELEADPDRAQVVASAGRDLVWTVHRVSSRAEQLRASLDADRRGQFEGSVWEDGRWCVRTLSPA